MRSLHLLFTITGLLLCQARAGYWGGCADNCIENLNIPNCNRDDFYYGWDCICTDRSALDSVNNCVTSSCSSSDQNSIFSNIAQACANKGSPITAVPAEATFSATSGGSLFASGWGSEYGSCASDGAPGFGRGKGHCNGWGGRCSWTTFTGSWGPGWLVSWSGFGGDGDCSATAGSSLSTATTPSSASATVTGGASPSLGATVITTVNGQTLTGTIFSAQGAAVSAATGTAGVVAQKNGGQASRNEKVGAFGAMVFALVATICML